MLVHEDKASRLLLPPTIRHVAPYIKITTGSPPVRKTKDYPVKISIDAKGYIKPRKHDPL
jgi:hypothetical protein